MRRSSLVAICIVAAAAPAWAESEAGEELPLSIAVAPFETVAPATAVVPDLATLIADRLATKGVERVIGPAESGLPPNAGPAADETTRWAKAANVDAVVVGRTTLIGRRLSIDVRVRDGATGRAAGTYVSEVAGSDELPEAVEQLSDQILTGARTAAAGLPAVAASGQSKPRERKGGGLLSRGRGPLSIRSDELEAVQSGESRKFIFKRNVRVRQGAMRISSNRLEAFYPPGQSQPEKLVATGNVVMRQEGREVSCDRATYLRAERKVFCRGNARMEEEGDTVHGEEIEFHLDSERMFVRGNAQLRVASEDGGAGEVAQ